MLIKFIKNNLIELKKYEEDLLLNKKLTNLVTSNMYELLFNNQNLDNLFNDVIDKLKNETNENFNVHVKNIWGFINQENEKESINFNHDFKNGINLESEYSFIYLIKSEKTIIYLKSYKNKIELEKGEILIFKTNDFIKEEPIDKDRMIIIGSISLIKNIPQIKKVLL